MCFAPQWRALFWHLNLQNCPNPWCFNILTSKCASRHNGVHFFDISTSKSGPTLRCYVHFDFKMCFTPQRRALFRHLNFQKWSDTEVLCTFWLQNVLHATTACTFSTSQLPKVVRHWCVLYILTWKCASRHNGVHFFISHLASWLRTCRFSEPTFRPSRASNHWKNTVFSDFPTFSRICIFFLLTLSLLLFSLLIFSLLSASALLCFSSVHIVGSLTSKLPSIMDQNSTVYQRILCIMDQNSTVYKCILCIMDQKVYQRFFFYVLWIRNLQYMNVYYVLWIRILQYINVYYVLWIRILQYINVYYVLWIRILQYINVYYVLWIRILQYINVYYVLWIRILQYMNVYYILWIRILQYINV